MTSLRHLRDEIERIRASGGVVRGIVLWNAERPLLATPRELTMRRSRSQKNPKREAALAT